MTVHDIVERLPAIDVLRMRCKALAMLDAIIGGDYYTYDRADGFNEIASMNNGSGDEYKIVFGGGGAIIWGIYHESLIFEHVDGPLWPRLIEGVPQEIQASLDGLGSMRDDAVDATFLIWRRVTDDRWQASSGIDFTLAEELEHNADGSWLLSRLLESTVEKYVDFADDVYEVQIEAAAVERIVALAPLTDEIVLELNPLADLAAIRDTAEAIGYPQAATP